MLRKVLVVLCGVYLLLLLVSCREKINETQGTSFDFEVPEYSVTEYDGSGYISEVKSINVDEKQITVSGVLCDAQNRIIKRKNNSNEIVYDYSLPIDVYSENEGWFLNDGYFTDGKLYESENKVHEYGEIMICRVIKALRSNSNNLCCLLQDQTKKYFIAEFDQNSNLIRKDEIKITEDKIIKDIIKDNGYYYIGVIEILMVGDEKSYSCSVMKLDADFDVVQEFNDIDIDSIDGVISQNDGSVIVYYYNQDSDETYVCKAVGDMTSFSDVKIFSGERKIFKTNTYDVIYISDSFNMNEYNIVTDEIKPLCAIPNVSEDMDYMFLYCDDKYFTYMLRENNDKFVDVSFDNNCTFYSTEMNGDIYDFTLDNNGDTTAINLKNGNKIIFDALNKEDIVIFHSSSGKFLAIDSDMEIKIYSDDGSYKIVNSKEKYYVDKVLNGAVPAGIFHNEKGDYYYANIDIDKCQLTNYRVISEIDCVKNADNFYNGNNDALFYVQINGFLCEYSIQNGMLVPFADLASFNIDSLLIGIKKISAENYQLITMNKIYCISQKNTTDKKDTIIIANLTPYSDNIFYSYYHDNFEDYKIKVVDYYTESGDYTELNKEIISGNIPDIFISNSRTDIQYLEKQRIYLKLDENELFDSNVEYLNNIVDLFKTNGELYKIPCGFSLAAILDCSDSNDKWNYDALIQWLESDKDKTYIGSKADMFSSFVPCFNNDFYNGEGILSESTRNTLKGIMSSIKLWNTVEDPNEAQNYFNDYYMIYDPIIVDDSIMMNINEDNYNICGYPTFDGEKIYVDSPLIISLSYNTANQKECYDFIRRAMKSSSGFSIEKEEYDNSINQIRFNLGNNIADNIEKLVMNATEIVSYRKDIDGIINEEMNSYYMDGKDADDVIDSINHRIAVYYNETR